MTSSIPLLQVVSYCGGGWGRCNNTGRDASEWIPMLPQAAVLIQNLGG